MVILARRSGDTWSAIRVTVKPLPVKPIVGVVVGTAEGEITIVGKNGKSVTIYLEDGAELPTEGQIITALGGNKGKGKGKGKGLVSADEILDRIQGFLEDATDEDPAYGDTDPSDDGTDPADGDTDPADGDTDPANGDTAPPGGDPWRNASFSSCQCLRLPQLRD